MAPLGRRGDPSGIVNDRPETLMSSRRARTVRPPSGHTNSSDASAPSAIANRRLILRQRVVLMTVRVHDVPYVPEAERVEVELLGRGFWKVVAHYGFMDEPDIPRAIELCRPRALAIDPMTVSFFLAHETMIPTPGQGLNSVEERVFMALAAAGLSATTYFQLPIDRVVEVGTQVEI